MKFPKTILICGLPHKLIFNPKSNGGSWDGDKRIIEIGCANPNLVNEILLHEVIEAIMSTRDVRYVPEMIEPDNGDYLFSFNHKEFSAIVKDLAASLKGVKL